MTTNQMYFFLKIVERKNLSRAADEMFLSQSSLSKQLKALETELGVTLFCRCGSRLTLTDAGTVFEKYALSQQQQWQELLANLSRYSNQEKPLIRLGALPLLHDYGLANQIALFQVEHTCCQVDLLEQDQADLMPLLDNGTIDLAFIRVDGLSTQLYQYTAPVRDKLVLVCSRSHPLAALSAVPWSLLREERLILLNQKSQVFHLVSHYLEQEHLEANVTYTTSRHLSLLAMVQEGLGVSIMPQRLVDTDHFGSLVCVQLEDSIWSLTALTRRRDRKLSAAAEQLYRYFQTHTSDSHEE